MTVSILVTVPILEDQTIDISLAGFTSSSVDDFAFDTAVFQADPVFLLNDQPPMSSWTQLGCIRDNLAERYTGMCYSYMIPNISACAYGDQCICASNLGRPYM